MYLSLPFLRYSTLNNGVPLKSWVSLSMLLTDRRRFPVGIP